MHDHMLFFRTQILYYYSWNKQKLSDYLRFVRYDSDIDIFRKYMPSNTANYGISVDIT